ncbi:hypothetical protein BN1263190030 [Stenotrophomonas maltophilia]|nr:hypothetical protein BN1263190030 [Stenotrophomonas maltophilia]
MSTTPTILLVHGFWGGAAHWAKVILELHRNGHDRVQAVELPLTSLADDAGRTRKMIRQIDGPVLLVGHSYGGAVISQAGNEPNVIHRCVRARCRRESRWHHLAAPAGGGTEPGT